MGSALLDETTIDDGTAFVLAAAVLVGCSSTSLLDEGSALLEETAIGDGTALVLATGAVLVGRGST